MATPSSVRAERVEKLINRLMKLSANDPGMTLRAQQILDRAKLPMSVVLNKVPGETVIEKAAKIGVSRQTYYSWQRGASWPSSKQAKKLAAITGYDWKAIFGAHSTPTRSSSTA